MLSVLIPTYNYDITQLVATLHTQLNGANIPFEIIVFDDCSNEIETIKKNESINNLNYCKYNVLLKNIGRSKIRNLLAKTAQYKWLLFLDADVAINSDNFINYYLENIHDTTSVIYGGIIYQKEKPKNEQILRWVYGTKRESLSVMQRIQNPYISFLTLNFIIKKDIFNHVCFNETIPNLRHEDTLFALDLKKQNIKVSHIENPIIHLGLENSRVFLTKSEEAVIAINLFAEEGLLHTKDVKITRIAQKLSAFSFIFIPFHNIFKSIMKKNLLGNHPSLFIFDVYRLGYLFNLEKEKNA